MSDRTDRSAVHVDRSCAWRPVYSTTTSTVDRLVQLITVVYVRTYPLNLLEIKEWTYDLYRIYEYSRVGARLGDSVPGSQRERNIFQ